MPGRKPHYFDKVHATVSLDPSKPPRSFAEIKQLLINSKNHTIEDADGVHTEQMTFSVDQEELSRADQTELASADQIHAASLTGRTRSRKRN